MHIRSFHIDGFGIFSDVRVEALSPGLSVFLGQNEAGKSTCLEFLRAMLTGYPDPRSREARRSHAPLRGGTTGGSLVLCAEGREPLHLTRRPGGNGGVLTVSGADGTMLQPELLQQLLFGVSREVYRNVFGFSLSELERFESLSAEGVRNALYGASFGPGLRSPGDALKILERQAEDIFKSGGVKPPLNKALSQLEELRGKIRDVEEECAGFDALALDLSQKKETLAQLRQRKSALEGERRLLERRLGVWRQWDEWRMLCARLEGLAPVDESFPEDGAARLARAQEARDSCERQWAAHCEKRVRLRARRDAVHVDQGLLDALPQLRILSERKSSFRQALTALPVQEESCKRAQADLERELARLGPDWSCERIRATDRSLFAREDLEKQAREMTAADSAHRAAVDALSKANRAVETAGRDVAAAREALALLPVPLAALPDEARDNLRQALARLEDGRRQLPGRERALHNARTAFARAYDPLRLSAQSVPQPDEALDALLARQEEALTLAVDVQERLREAAEASLAVQQAEEQVETIKSRMEQLREEQRNVSGPSREALDGRAAALRSLRALSANLTTERERLQELDNRISNEQAPSPVKSLPLLVVGALLILAGAGILLGYWRWGLTSLPLTDTLALPVSLWSGYLVLVCGVGFLAGGLPRSGPEAKRHRREMDQLRNRRETCALHVAELGEQARQLCAAANVESMDPVTLEATEMLLEREREQCFNEERSRKDMNALKREMDAAATQVSAQQGRRHELESVVQQTRRRWHEFMLSLHVSTVPAPEGAAAFFARAESARLAFSGLAAAEAELRALEEDLREQENQMRAVPAVAERLADRTDSAALAECVRQVLESCREADAAREQRIKASAALQNRESELERAQDMQVEASEQLHAAEERLRAAREIWGQCLQGLGLGDDLDPETVREAFKYMENCLAAESALERSRMELAQSREELAALRDPLAGLLADLGRMPGNAQETERETDWLAALDAALADAESMAAAQAERARLAALLAEEEDEVRACEAALNKAAGSERNLLALAGAADAEDFLRLAALREEQRSLSRRCKELEDALRLAADRLPLEEFLASFKEAEQESQEKRSVAIEEELSGLLDQEQDLTTAVAGLSARVSTLARADELADLRQQEASLLESMERMAFAWSRRALAREILLAAKRIFERERQPEVIRQASEIFARITNRRWRGISASLENSSLSILPEQGEPVAPEVLSRGTQEQAYLALRLAYIKNHAAQAAALPVIMDEVLVNFDPQRAERTARAFVELTSGQDGPAHQLLYFTCQPHMVEILRKAEPHCALFKVEHGSIEAVTA
ncbi:AAA family ATPase [Desulfovibrio sp. ZJ200]|uniref:AAA family ATPase n=1 Tax=Desulfovibrio sp. ZJ200 TaxID=2709792 RepID=UPI0013EDA15E|nr:AAA family ATPase [Desulfovibrio sp. ZJ200]